MYTYEMFEIDGVFTLFWPLFITMLLLSILLFIAIILPKVRKRYINTFTVVSISIVTVLLSTQFRWKQDNFLCIYSNYWH
ncbi:hypothetical protein [Viridibacillus arvi]|uniref:hypothetical protein n=1 Tax=Viridibacillus arvi TaxID=263475 RepID=UPI003D002E3F